MDKIHKLERKDLGELMTGIIKVPLTLVVAPMGYGKSTAVRKYIDSLEGYKNIWVNLGQNKVNDEIFWQKLCKKILSTGSSIYEKLKDMGMPTEDKDTERIVDIISEKLNQPKILVIDDFQEYEGDIFKKLIVKLSYEDIPDFHIVVISRFFPDIPYEEMMIKRYCNIINQQPFILSRDEVEEICVKSGLDFTESEMDNILKYTDGWISALYLVLIEYRQKKQLKLSASIIHLVKTAILDNLPARIKIFLTKMSLFDDFNIEAACYVTEIELKSVELDEIMESVGFIEYDAATDKYSLHSLLKTAALDGFNNYKLDKEYILKRGGRWYENQKIYVSAMLYYMSAKDVESVFRILDKDERFLVLEAIPNNIIDFMENIPFSKRVAYPKAYFSYIYFLVTAGTIPQKKYGVKLFNELRDNIEYAAGETECYNDILGELKILESNSLFNDIEKVNHCMEEAFILRNGKASEYFRDIRVFYGIPESTILWYKTPGELKKTIDLEKNYCKIHRHLITKVDAGWDNFIDAQYDLLTGNFKAALKNARLALEKAKFRNQLSIILGAYGIFLRYSIYNGDKGLFDKSMEEIKAEMSDETRTIFYMIYEQVLGYTYACINKTEEVPEWIRDYKFDECNYFVRNIRSGCTIYGMFLIKKQQWACLESIAEQMYLPFDNLEFVYVDIVANIYKAIAMKHLIGIDESAKYLEHALSMAVLDNVVIPFIENAEEILEILQYMEKRDAFAEKLIPMCQKYMENNRLFSQRNKKFLTDREYEIMYLVKEGRRNIDIGKELNIAMVTVEKSLTNIYRKLNVTNRTAAIVKFSDIYGI